MNIRATPIRPLVVQERDTPPKFDRFLGTIIVVLLLIVGYGYVSNKDYEDALLREQEARRAAEDRAYGAEDALRRGTVRLSIEGDRETVARIAGHAAVAVLQ